MFRARLKRRMRFCENLLDKVLPFAAAGSYITTDHQFQVFHISKFTQYQASKYPKFTQYQASKYRGKIMSQRANKLQRPFLANSIYCSDPISKMSKTAARHE